MRCALARRAGGTLRVARVWLERPVGEDVVCRALEPPQRVVEELRVERVHGAERHRPVADVHRRVRPARRDRDLVARSRLDHDHVADLGRRRVLHVDEPAAVPELVQLRVADARVRRHGVHVALAAQRLAAESAVVVHDRAVPEAVRAQRLHHAGHADVHVDRVEVLRTRRLGIPKEGADLVEAAHLDRGRRDALGEGQSQALGVHPDGESRVSSQINHVAARFITKRAATAIGLTDRSFHVPIRQVRAGVPQSSFSHDGPDHRRHRRSPLAAPA